MRRANGEGLLRKRSNGTWEGRLTVGYDESGNQITKSIYGKTKKAVSDRMNQMKHDLKQGSYVEPTKETVDSFYQKWITDYLIEARDSTKYQYSGYYRNYIVDEIGSVEIQKVSDEMIQTLINKAYKKPLAPKTVRNLHGILHHLFSDAVRFKIINRNPAEYTKLPKVEQKEMLILEGANLKAFMQEIKGKPFEQIFYIDTFIGVREGEILGLTWDCIDFENETILIKQQLKRDSRIGEKSSAYILSPTKTGNYRLLHPAPSVFAALKTVRAEQARNRLKYGKVYDNPNNLVFTDEIGHFINGRTLLKHFKKRIIAIGLPKEFRFHDLRHTHTAIRLENGDDLKMISSDLGHTNISTTANIYAHLTQRAKKDSADRMETFIKSLDSAKKKRKKA